MAHLHVIYARTCTHEAYFRLLCEVILHGDKGIGLSLFSTDLSAFCMLPFPWPGLPITSVNIQFSLGTSCFLRPLSDEAYLWRALAHCSGGAEWKTPSTWFARLGWRLSPYGGVSDLYLLPAQLLGV